MDSTARAARSDDTTGLKMDGLHYIVATLTDVNAEQSLTLLQLANKSSRGFQNVLVGRLLCQYRLASDKLITAQEDEDRRAAGGKSECSDR